MKNDFDDLLRRWLHDRGRTDAGDLARLAGHVAVLPPRRPARISWLARAAVVVVVAAVGLVGVVLSQGRFGSTGDAGPSAPPPAYGEFGPAASCDDPELPPMPIPCANSYRLGDQAGANVDRARIWLTSIDAVKERLDPMHITAEPRPGTPVWLIVYDGSWTCCPNAYNEDGTRIPQGRQTRWLVTADATTGQDGYIFFQPWSDRPVPATMPGPDLRLFDPAPFAGDPRYAACASPGDAVFDAFALRRARDFWLYLPAAGRAPELELDTPALVVIYRGRYPGPIGGAPPPVGQTWPPAPTLAPGHRDVCVAIGSGIGSADRNIYTDISLEGFDRDRVPRLALEAGLIQAPPFPAWPGIAWTDRDGTIVRSDVIAAFRASSTCGSESGAFLEVGWPFGMPINAADELRRYVRDPEGTLAASGRSLAGPFDADATLPADATFTSHRSGGIELWTSPASVDEAVFLRWPDHDERWPRDQTAFNCD